MASKLITKAQQAAGYYLDKNQVKSIIPLGGGLINKTFLIIFERSDEKLILQNINKMVFSDPLLVMQNIEQALFYVAGQETSLEFPRFLKTRNGRYLHLDEQGEFWRLMTFIPHTLSFDKTEDLAIIAGMAESLAKFHLAFNDAPLGNFSVTLPGFHKTTSYLKKYEEDLLLSVGLEDGTAKEDNYCRQIISRYGKQAAVLEEATERGELALSIMHGDPKLSNILFDAITKRPRSIIDLDTIMPGLILYDVGDAVRSVCNLAGEDNLKNQKIEFDLKFFATFWQSYRRHAALLINDGFIKYLFAAIWLLPFELGLRFFLDYLQGNVYFKIDYPQHNLKRALGQFHLMEDIFVKKEAILKIIRNG